MDSRQLKRWQAERMHRALAPGLRYLGRLKSRMEQVGFLPNDPLFLLVRQAYDAMHRLSIDLHYRSCAGGVGERRKKE